MVVVYQKQSNDQILTPQSLSFKQINTEDYDLSRVQSNINDLKNDITTLLSQTKFNVFSAICSDTTLLAPLTSIDTGYSVGFNQNVSDQYNAYNQVKNAFVCPIDALYVISVNIAMSVASSPQAALYMRIGASDNGPANVVDLVDTNSGNPLNSVIFLKCTKSIKLQAGSTLSILACWLNNVSASFQNSCITVEWQT